tara:strand:- start:183 stop:992 length:810 start_codon:yes stop_codon:yes gene_type:complete
MPYPDNLKFANKSESICRKLGVTPATIGIIDGCVCVGLSFDQLAFICNNKKNQKISRRDIGVAITNRWSGGTTVSATMQISYNVGIRVFSTGGIGGVHRGFNKSLDVSQDLLSLKETPMVVISSGAKAILDIGKTIENLETNGVVVLGYGTNTFSAFYSRKTAFKIQRVNAIKKIVETFKNHISFGLSSSVLVSNPIPKKHNISTQEIEQTIQNALKKASDLQVYGKNLTPFLLNSILTQSKGRSLVANKSLALNNVRLGAKISHALSN